MSLSPGENRDGPRHKTLRGHTLVLLVNGLLASGCMTHEVAWPDAPARTIELSGWTTARSRHFLLHTDAGVGAIEAIITRFEHTYQALSTSFFLRAEVPAVEALVFADESEYREVAGASAGRFLAGVGATGGVLVVRHTENPDALDQVVAHELAHRFVHAVHPHLPNWIDEGIATYFGSVDVRETEVHFGAAPRRPAHGFALAGGVSFTDLLNATPERLYGPEARFFYAAAWALVHYLLTGRDGALRPRFESLLSAIQEDNRQRRPADRAFAEVYPDLPASELDQAIERLTAHLDRPGVEQLLIMPFRRAPAVSIDRQRADPQAVGAVVDAVQRRNWRAPEPVIDLAARPHFAAVEVHGLSRLDHVGVLYGFMFRSTIAGELDLGLGPLGYTAAGLARYHVNVGEGGNFFVSGGLGPMAAVRSHWLGNEIEHHQDRLEEPPGFYYYLGLQPEITAEVRTPVNIVIRAGVGGYVRLLENQSHLCTGARPADAASGCAPSSGRSGTQIAQARHHLFGRLALGYSW